MSERALKRAYHHGDLRRALVDAALAEIREDGAHGLSLRRVAARAGVSHAAPYRHFADREALLAAVAEQGFAGMAVRMDARAGEHGDPVEALIEIGVAYVEFAATHPAHFTAMFSPQLSDKSAHPSLRDAAKETFAVLLEAVSTCQRAGRVRPGEPMGFALTAWSAVHGLSSLIVDGQIEDGTARAVGLAQQLGRNLHEGIAI